MALTPEERHLVSALAISGEIVLKQRGWNKEKRDKFLQRKDVQRELSELDKVYKERDNVAERARFFGMLEMQRMVPRAVSVLQRALYAGQEVNGQLVQAPDESQLDAALQVLDRTGVHVAKNPKEAGGAGLAKIGDVTINNLSMGDNVADRTALTLMREKMRTRIAELLHKQVKAVEGNIVEGRVIPRKKNGRT